MRRLARRLQPAQVPLRQELAPARAQRELAQAQVQQAREPGSEQAPGRAQVQPELVQLAQVQPEQAQASGQVQQAQAPVLAVLADLAV